MLAFLRETGVRLVQLRNLNIDPEVLLPRLPTPRGRPMGMAAMVETLRRELPDLRIGNFSIPVQRVPAAALPSEQATH